MKGKQTTRTFGRSLSFLPACFLLTSRQSSTSPRSSTAPATEQKHEENSSQNAQHETPLQYTNTKKAAREGKRSWRGEAAKTQAKTEHDNSATSYEPISGGSVVCRSFMQCTAMSIPSGPPRTSAWSSSLVNTPVGSEKGKGVAVNHHTGTRANSAASAEGARSLSAQKQIKHLCSGSR